MATIAGTSFIAFTGIIAASAIYLAFLPPAFYRRWVGERSASTV